MKIGIMIAVHVNTRVSPTSILIHSYPTMLSSEAVPVPLLWIIAYKNMSSVDYSYDVTQPMAVNRATFWSSLVLKNYATRRVFILTSSVRYLLITCWLGPNQRYCTHWREIIWYLSLASWRKSWILYIIVSLYPSMLTLTHSREVFLLRISIAAIGIHVLKVWERILNHTSMRYDREYSATHQRGKRCHSCGDNWTDTSAYVALI